MNTQPTDSRPEPEPPLSPPDWGDIAGLLVFLLLALGALAAPHVALQFAGVYWAAAVAFGVFVAWIGVMPTTCMSGGLYASMIAIAILFNTIAIVMMRSS